MFCCIFLVSQMQNEIQSRCNLHANQDAIQMQTNLETSGYNVSDFQHGATENEGRRIVTVGREVRWWVTVLPITNRFLF